MGRACSPEPEEAGVGSLGGRKAGEAGLLPPRATGWRPDPSVSSAVAAAAEGPVGSGLGQFLRPAGRSGGRRSGLEAWRWASAVASATSSPVTAPRRLPFNVKSSSFRMLTTSSN